MTTFLGIDPGISGAFALWTPGRPALSVFDMPVTKTIVSGRERKAIDRPGVRQLLDVIFDTFPIERIVLEKVGQMPGQSGMFTFGFGVGCVLMAIEDRGRSVIQPSPIVWKKDLKVPRDKAAAITRANDLFPSEAALLFHDIVRGKRVARPDRAEAAMLALWAEKHAT